MFIKMLLMTIGGVSILVAVFMFAFPDVWDATKDFDWSRMAEAIITHFGMNLWRAQPWKVAERLSQETGIRVIAARDGIRFDLAQLVGV